MRGDFFVRTWGENVICNSSRSIGVSPPKRGPQPPGWGAPCPACSGSTRMKNSDVVVVAVVPRSPRPGCSRKKYKSTHALLLSLRASPLSNAGHVENGIYARAFLSVNTLHIRTPTYDLLDWMRLPATGLQECGGFFSPLFPLFFHLCSGGWRERGAGGWMNEWNGNEILIASWIRCRISRCTYTYYSLSAFMSLIGVMEILLGDFVVTWHYWCKNWDLKVVIEIELVFIYLIITNNHITVKLYGLF